MSHPLLSTVPITAWGITALPAVWEHRIQAKPGTLRARLRYGWSLEMATAVPAPWTMSEFWTLLTDEQKDLILALGDAREYQPDLLVVESTRKPRAGSTWSCSTCKAPTSHSGGICAACRTITCKQCGKRFTYQIRGRMLCAECIRNRNKRDR